MNKQEFEKKWGHLMPLFKDRSFDPIMEEAESEEERTSMRLRKVTDEALRDAISVIEGDV